jgi:hypothetical protein
MEPQGTGMPRMICSSISSKSAVWTSRAVTP